MLASQKLLTNMLSKMGYKTVVIENGGAAMMRFKELKGMGDERSEEEEAEFMKLKKKFMNMKNPDNGAHGKQGKKGKMGKDSKY